MFGDQQFLIAAQRVILFLQEHPDAVRCPRGDTTAEKISVFCPDRTAKAEGSCQHRPIFGISPGSQFARLNFEFPIDLAANQFN